MTQTIKIIPPTNCPCCDSELQMKNNILYCVNKTCSAQSQKRVEHFAKTLKIKGLGPRSIERLGLTTPQEIYSLNKKRISEALGSEKVAEKLVEEIENSKNISLNTLLPALSIPLIGRSATEKLAAVYDDFIDMTEDSALKAKLGPKSTENLMNYVSNHYWDILDFPFSLVFEKPLTLKPAGVVCISGKLKSFKTKAEATEALKSVGYEVKGSVTKDVTILINESGIESAKTTKARESGVTIITNLKQFLENNK